jgi:hypothetical protein
VNQHYYRRPRTHRRAADHVQHQVPQDQYDNMTYKYDSC